MSTPKTRLQELEKKISPPQETIIRVDWGDDEGTQDDGENKTIVITWEDD